MLDKIEFSDIYKFLASIGIGLILAAFLLPIYLFQIDLLKNYRNIDIVRIAYTMKQSIQSQDTLSYLLMNNW